MLIIQSKKLTIAQTFVEFKNKITANHDHVKYITTQEFDKLILEHCTSRLKQENLSKSDIAKVILSS